MKKVLIVLVAVAVLAAIFWYKPFTWLQQKQREFLQDLAATSAARVQAAQEAAEEASRPREHITAEEVAEAQKLEKVRDPVLDEIYQYRLKVRNFFNNRDFAALEREAAAAMESPQLFENGSWRIFQYHCALECSEKEPARRWTEHERIYQQWLAAYPQSLPAHVAYVEFLTNYAWLARGSGYANTVKSEGWRLFHQRLEQAENVLAKGRELPGNDPALYTSGLTVALGQGWSAGDYERLLTEAQKAAPQFWGVQTSRAYSLLPRWYGEEGDWEKYAEEQLARPEGLKEEGYARIVMNMDGYYDNVFRETEASWSTTREGLKQLLAKYPRSLELQHEAAKLAGYAQDREFAQEVFGKIGNRWLPSAWGKPERMVHVRHWAQTGEW